jgi:hypothetical protein
MTRQIAQDLAWSRFPAEHVPLLISDRWFKEAIVRIVAAMTSAQQQQTVLPSVHLTVDRTICRE